MSQVVDHLPRTGPRPCLSPGSLWSQEGQLYSRPRSPPAPRRNLGSARPPEPCLALPGSMGSGLSSAGLLEGDSVLSTSGGRQPGLGPWLGGGPWPPAWEADPSARQPQLNASVSAFQRRFVVDVRRCEELEKTFSELAPGQCPRQASWRRCQLSLV